LTSIVVNDDGDWMASKVAVTKNQLLSNRLSCKISVVALVTNQIHNGHKYFKSSISDEATYFDHEGVTLWINLRKG
jgi:hypothetical protein